MVSSRPAADTFQTQLSPTKAANCPRWRGDPHQVFWAAALSTEAAVGTTGAWRLSYMNKGLFTEGKQHGGELGLT